MQNIQNLKYPQKIKAGYYLILLLTLMLLPVSGFTAQQHPASWLDEPVTVRFQNEPLSQVLERVSQQTGIAVLYDQELANEKVSGNYKDVKASDAITRLFSGKNKSIQVSKDEKVIIVKTFGAKNFIRAGGGNGALAAGSGLAESMTVAELEKIHARQYKEYKDSIDDENEIFAGGMTRREVRAMHEQQKKEFQRMASDPNQIDTFTGLTNAETKKLHAMQYSTIQQQVNNVKSIDPLTGTTLAKVRNLHAKQAKQFQQEYSKDPFTGKTVEEIRVLHERQARELKSGS